MVMLFCNWVVKSIHLSRPHFYQVSFLAHCFGGPQGGPVVYWALDQGNQPGSRYQNNWVTSFDLCGLFPQPLVEGSVLATHLRNSRCGQLDGT